MTQEEAAAHVEHAIVRSIMPEAFAVIGELQAFCKDPELAKRCGRLCGFWDEAKEVLTGRSPADKLAVQVLPQAYVAIDDLLDETAPPKDLLIRAKKCLPAWASHSFEQRPLGKK